MASAFCSVRNSSLCFNRGLFRAWRELGPSRPCFKPVSRGCAGDDRHGFCKRFTLLAVPFMFPQVAASYFFFYVAPLSKLLFLLIIIMIRMRRGFFNKVLRAAWEKGRSAVSSLVRPCDSPAGVLLYCLSTSWLNATSQELFWRRRCLPVPPRAPPLQHLQRSRAPKPCFLCRSF